MKVHYQISKYNENGLVRRYRKLLSRSFVKQFLQILYSKMYTSISVLDIDNVARTLSLSSFPGGAAISAQGYCIYPLAGVTYFQSPAGYGVPVLNGIALGDSTTAVEITDASILSLIAEGTSTDQLEYLGCYATDVVVSAPSASFTLERFMRNSSGGTVTINEVGIYVYCENVGKGFMIVRDLVSPGVDVDDGEYLKVVYTFTITV